MLRSLHKEKLNFRGLIYWQCGLALSAFFVATSISFCLFTGGLTLSRSEGSEKFEEKSADYTHESASPQFRATAAFDQGGSPGLVSAILNYVELLTLIPQSTNESLFTRTAVHLGIDPLTCWAVDLSPPL